MKNYLFFIVLIFINTFHGISQTFELNGNEFKKIEGIWYEYYNEEFYKLNENTITIKFKEQILDSTILKFVNSKNTEIIRKNRLGYYDLKIAGDQNIFNVYSELSKCEIIELVELNTFGKFENLPNDSGYCYQWYLAEEENKYGIEANKAWEKSVGDSNLIIAVLDSGADYFHPDLADNIFVNQGEDINDNGLVWDESDLNGIDDDQNGYIDDLIGWDFSSNSNNIIGSASHGTHVAGTIAAKTNNSIGVSGVAGGWGTNLGSKVLICQVGEGSIDVSILDDVIIYAAEMGASIITMSFVVAETTAINDAIIDAVETYDCFVIGCAGNEYSGVDYPASHPDCFAVGASDTFGLKADFSNFGYKLDLVAPGVGIYNIDKNNSYASMSGTSASAPQVAGTVALIRTVYPYFTNENIRNALCSTTEKVGDTIYNYEYQKQYGSWDFNVGYGKLNAERALGLLEINRNIILKEGNFLAKSINMEYGTEVLLDTNSILTIWEDGILNIYGGEIQLALGSTLIINGNINIKDNSNLLVEGVGSIVLNGTITAEPGATLTINGSGKTTKLLEVQKSIAFDTDFANVTIQNGKVIMNNSTSELYFNNGIDNITLNNIWVTSATGTTNNSHQGIDIRSDGNITLTNSTFEQGYYGVYASRGAISPNLNVNNCTFKYCNYGLRVYNGGLTASGCTAEYNTVRGIYCNSMDLAGSITNFTIRYQNGTGDYGLYYDGASTAALTMQYNAISNNYYGVCLSGDFGAQFKCNYIINNTNSGISAQNNTIVYLANTSGINAGYNDLHGNKYALIGSGTLQYFNSFYLNNGYNDLRDNGTSGSYCMSGQFGAYCSGSIAANNNYWKIGGGAPIDGVDYLLYGGCYDLNNPGTFERLQLTDNSPEGTFYLCETPGELMEGTTTTTTAETSEVYRTVTTDLGTLPLNETVEATLNSDAETGTVFNDETQFNLMAQTLNNNLAALNPAEEKQATHTYRMFRSNLGKQIAEKGTVDAAQLDNMLQVIEKLKADEKQSHGKKAPRKHTARYFALSMDEAQTLWLKQEYAGAIALLQELTAKATDDQLCEIQKTLCQIEADREFVASNNTLDIEELLIFCEDCGTNQKSGQTYDNDDEDFELGGSRNISINPNPIRKNGEILIYSKNASELKIYKMNGKLVNELTIMSGISQLSISDLKLIQGFYLFSFYDKIELTKIQKKVIIIN